MKLVLNMDCDNAAFADAPEFEVANILREFADDLEDRGTDRVYPLVDTNGNRVGTAQFESGE